MPTTYRELLVEVAPRPISSQAAYHRALRQIERLITKPRRTHAEDDMIALLAMLIEQYEIGLGYVTPQLSPRDRLAGLIEGLVVDAVRMRANLESSQGLIHSQQVLLALTEAGLDRQAAYAIVQRHAMRAWQEKLPLLDLLRADPEVSARIDADALAGLFDLDRHLGQVDHIFARVFGADAAH